MRLAAAHPERVASWTAIETGLPGFGLEMLADVTHGGAWHIGVLAAPGVPEMLLVGREHALLAEYAFPSLSAGRRARRGSAPAHAPFDSGAAARERAAISARQM